MGRFFIGPIAWLAALAVCSGCTLGGDDSSTVTEGPASSETAPAMTTPTSTPTSGSPTSTPQPTPTPKVSPTPPPVDRSVSPIPAGVPGEVRAITVGRPLAFSEDWVLLISTGCWQCEGAGGLARFAWGDGQLTRDAVLDERHGVMQADDLLGATQAADDPFLVAAVCSGGSCGGFDFWAEDPETTLLRSDDRGLSWYELGVYEHAYRVSGASNSGILVSEGFGAPPDPPPPVDVLLPDGLVLVPPADGAYSPFMTDQGPVWRIPDGSFVDSLGVAALDGRVVGYAGSTGNTIQVHVPRWSEVGRLMIGWEDRGDVTEPFVTIVDADGSEITYYLGHWLSDDYVDFVPQAWIGDDLLVGRVLDAREGPFSPSLAVLDVESGVMHPVPLGDPRELGLRGVIAAFVDTE